MTPPKEVCVHRHRVEVAITGAQVSPERVAVRDLIDVLTRIERAVDSYAEAHLGEVPEEARLSLVDIKPGSECLVFSVPDPLVGAMAVISKAIDLEDYAELPGATYHELYALSESVTRRGWGLEIRELPEQGIHHARIDAAKPLAPPPRPAAIQGTTAIHGRCLRVGGATEPKAEIRLSATEKLLNVALSEELAKEVAKRLYEEVVLEGTATWSTETWEIESFRVSRVTDYRKTDPDLAFKELAEAAEGKWEGVDALDYVRGLRRDD